MYFLSLEVKGLRRSPLPSTVNVAIVLSALSSSQKLGYRSRLWRQARLPDRLTAFCALKDAWLSNAPINLKHQHPPPPPPGQTSGIWHLSLSREWGIWPQEPGVGHLTNTADSGMWERHFRGHTRGERCENVARCWRERYLFSNRLKWVGETNGHSWGSV